MNRRALLPDPASRGNSRLSRHLRRHLCSRPGDWPRARGIYEYQQEVMNLASRVTPQQSFWPSLAMQPSRWHSLRPSRLTARHPRARPAPRAKRPARAPLTPAAAAPSSPATRPSTPSSRRLWTRGGVSREMRSVPAPLSLRTPTTGGSSHGQYARRTCFGGARARRGPDGFRPRDRLRRGPDEGRRGDPAAKRRYPRSRGRRRSGRRQHRWERHDDGWERSGRRRNAGRAQRRRWASRSNDRYRRWHGRGRTQCGRGYVELARRKHGRCASGGPGCGGWSRRVGVADRWQLRGVRAVPPEPRDRGVGCCGRIARHLAREERPPRPGHATAAQLAGRHLGRRRS